MIDTESVRHALGELERHAPDEAAVLAGVQAGIVRRRRRRQVASVTGVALAAALVALGVVVALPGRGAEQVGSAPPPASSPASTLPPSTPVSATPGLLSPALPYTVAVPAGYQLDAWQVGVGTSGAQYVGNADFEVVVVELSDRPRDTYALASERPVTVGGRPGRIVQLASDQNETQILWQITDGQWAMVGGRAPQVTEAELMASAESLAVRPSAGNAGAGLDLTAVPEGYQVISWSGTGATVGSATLCRGPVPLRGELPADCLSVSLRDGAAPAATQTKTKTGGVVDVPVDRLELVNGVATRASADGRTVFAQVDPGHWAGSGSQGADVALLRQIVTMAKAR
jgi:hypothetical protein